MNSPHQQSTQGEDIGKVKGLIVSTTRKILGIFAWCCFSKPAMAVITIAV